MSTRTKSTKVNAPDDQSEHHDSSGSKRLQEKLKQDGEMTITDEETEKREESAISAGEDSDSVQEVELIGDGKDLKGEDDEELKIVMGTEADVTAEDLVLLGDPDQDQDGGDDEMLSNEGLDDTDFDGDLLNESKSDVNTTGEDLDMPDSEDYDPKKDRVGGADEENDYYSLGSDNNDEMVEGTP